MDEDDNFNYYFRDYNEPPEKDTWNPYFRDYDDEDVEPSGN